MTQKRAARKHQPPLHSGTTAPVHGTQSSLCSALIISSRSPICLPVLSLLHISHCKIVVDEGLDGETLTHSWGDLRPAAPWLSRDYSRATLPAPVGGLEVHQAIAQPSSRVLGFGRTGRNHPPHPCCSSLQKYYLRPYPPSIKKGNHSLVLQAIQ